MFNEDLLEQARGLSDRIVALRRAIHAEPELGLDTPKTRDKVRAALAHLPLTWREGKSTTGVVATLVGTGQPKPGAPLRKVLLRGDMDALAMGEETGLDFASTIPGTMHSCGHDTHTAMLAGAAELLCARAGEFAGEVQFMFQPGEEGFHGARFMLDDGLVDPETGAAFALHIMPNQPHGLVAGRDGALLASADKFDVTVTGRGGHAAMPYSANDPVPVAAEIVLAIQTAVTRRFPMADPVVISVTQVEAGTAHNIIPEVVHMHGTIRTLSPQNREMTAETIARIAKNVAAAHEMTAEVTVTKGFPVTMCDPRAVVMGEAIARELRGPAAFHRMAVPLMGAEDFSYVLERFPGAMFFLGVAHEGADWANRPAIHSPHMLVDETALPLGTALLAGCATRFLAEGFA